MTFPANPFNSWGSASRCRSPVAKTEVMEVACALLATLRYSTEHETYTASSEFNRVPASTLWHHETWQTISREVAAQKQYLNPPEEKALADYVLRMAERGYPAPVKLLRHLAWAIARRRSSTFQIPADDDEVRTPGKN